MVLANDQEPCDSESSGISRVDDRINDENICESEALEGGLRADVWGEIGDEDESDDGVDVHAQLEGGEV